MSAAIITPVLKSTLSKSSPISSSWHGSLSSGHKSSSVSSCLNDQPPNIGMSDIDVEKKIHAKVKLLHNQLLQAFKTYDTDNTQSVTRGEFRRVIELFCIPLTTSQFNSFMLKVAINKNGTVRYADFLNKFKATPSGSHQEKVDENDTVPKQASIDSDKCNVKVHLPPAQSNSVYSHRSIRSSTPIARGRGELLKQNISTEQIVAKLRNHIVATGEPRTLVKALRLFDYNRDSKIQKHELRKVLENYCFQMSDIQYERLWNMFDVNNSGVINYLEFLNTLGIPLNSSTAPAPLKKKATQLTLSTVNGNSKNLDDLEFEFRQKVKAQFQTLQKAFLSFDTTRSGFVSLEDMRSVLNQFIMPLNEERFVAVMERCGFKATGRIAWLTFLQKFQDPQGLTNGQTIPVKFNHKANPIRGAEQSANLDELLELLFKHMTDMYASMRAAFLNIDNKRQGWITPKEFRKILDRFKFNISEHQFRQLMFHLDPHNTGQISYHHFLHLFEEREGLDGHKWLKSVHRYNNTKNMPLNDAAVEDLIQEKLTKDWHEVCNYLKTLDHRGTGLISFANLHKMIEKICFPIKMEQLKEILASMNLQLSTPESVNYLEFLTILGADGKPGDIAGLSDQIAASNEESVINREIDHNNRMSGMSGHAIIRTEEMPIDEVIVRIKDRFMQKHTSIHDAVKKFDPKKKGIVTRVQFRKSLGQYGFQFSDAQFEALCEEVGFNSNACIPYTRFLKIFEQHGGEMEGTFIPYSNHRVNSIRGDEFGMPADVLESRVRDKIRDNFSTLREAFCKFSPGNEGTLDKASFRRLCDHFMLITNDEEFHKLCQILKVDENTQLDYHQFKDMFEVKETKDGHKWLDSVHRYNALKPIGSLSAEQVAKLLPIKLKQCYSDVARAFCHTDSQGQGYITKKEFRALLNKLLIPLDSKEFKVLWNYYDPSARNVLTYNGFLKYLQMARDGDTHGISSNIIQQSHDVMADQVQDQNNRHYQITNNQANLGCHLKNTAIYAKVKNRIRDDFSDVQTAFKAYDKDKKNVFTVENLRCLLEDIHLFLNESQFIHLATKMGFKGPEDSLDYVRFSAAFEDPASGPKCSPDQDSRATISAASSKASSINDLNEQEVEKKLKEVISNQNDILQKAFQSFDKELTGRVKINQFRSILDNFCFKLKDSHFKYILSKTRKVGEDEVDYIGFLEVFKVNEASLTCLDWLTSMNKSIRAKTPKPLSQDQVQERIKESVTARAPYFLQAFQEFDYAKLGVVCKQDFNHIISQMVMRLTDEQLDRLWATLPVNEFGNMDYNKFLSQFKCEERYERTSLEDADKDFLTTSMVNNRTQNEDEPNNRPSSAIFTRSKSLGDLSDVERQLKECFAKHWKTIFNRCKVLDVGPKYGLIKISDFLDILLKVGRIDLLPSDLVPLIAQHGLHRSGQFCYQPFLKSLVLSNPLPKIENKEVITKKLKASGISICEDPSSLGVFDVRRLVLTSWKPLRKTFIDTDTDGNGTLPIGKWRRVLTKFNVKLSDDEFYHLATQLDSGHSGKIHYNDFLKTFLKSA